METPAEADARAARLKLTVARLISFSAREAANVEAAGRRGGLGAVCSYSMRVRVSLRRDAGRPRPLFGQREAATGNLHLTYVSANGRKIQALQLLSADRECPRLFEPRLVALSTNVMRFVGFERAADAWVMQEWECEVL